MIISFLNDVSRAQLIQDILWYVHHGECCISHELIHIEPVRLIIGDGDERYEDSDPDVEELDSDAEESDEESDSAAEQASVTVASELSDAPVEGSEPVSLDIINPHLYERREVDNWFNTRKARVDPTSMLEVRSVESVITQEINFDLKDDLHKLTWFIKTYLASLQHHIETANTAELQYWLACWQAAALALKDPETKLSFQKQDCAIDMEELNIYLPNRRTIMATACRSQHRAHLEPLLRDNYKMQYCPTRYVLFMQFLQQAATQTKAAQVDTLYGKLFAQLQPQEQMLFLSMPVLQATDEDVESNNQEHINMYPLQLACYLQNIPAVKALIRAGVPLRIYLADDHIVNDQDWRLAPQYKYSEIMHAIIHDNLDLFKELKCVYMPFGFDYLIELVLNFIIFFDKPKFLKLLIEDYEIHLNMWNILLLTLKSEDLPSETLKYLLQENKADFAYVRYTQINDLFPLLFNRIDQCSNSAEIRQTEVLIVDLLAYGFPKFYQYTARITIFPSDLQPELYLSHEIASLLPLFENKYREYLLAGRVREATEHALELIVGNIYRTLFANPDVYYDLQDSERLTEFINTLAGGDLRRGDFSKSGILATARRLLVGYTPEGYIDAFSGFQVTTDNREKRLRISM